MSLHVCPLTGWPNLSGGWPNQKFCRSWNSRGAVVWGACYCQYLVVPNKYAGKNMVRFNDRPFKDGEMLSNGEDLSGNIKMSKDSMMTMMGVVVGVFGIKRRTMPSNGEDLSGDDKIIKDSDDDNDDGSGGGVWDKREDNAKQWRRFERRQQQYEQG
jgi:hypothetical protein